MKGSSCKVVTDYKNDDSGYLQPEPTMYSRCFCWFPGPLAPSVTNSYTNTDYVVIRSTSHNPKTKKVASYDIMCQWGLNLQNHLKDFPLINAEDLDHQIVACLVPKFHLDAHKESVIWKAQRGHGLASKEADQQRIRDQGTGVMPWMTSLVTGIGQSLSISVWLSNFLFLQ